MAEVSFPTVGTPPVNVDVLSMAMVPEPFVITTESILGRVSQRRFGAPFGGRWRGAITFPGFGSDRESVMQRAAVQVFIEDMNDFATLPPRCRVPVDSLVNTQGEVFFPTPAAPFGDVRVVRQQQRPGDGDVVTHINAAPTLMVGHYLNVNIGTNTMLVRVREIVDAGGTQIIIRPSHVLDGGTPLSRATVLSIRSDFNAEPPVVPQTNEAAAATIVFQFVEETY